MWVFAKQGFVSIVRDRGISGHLLVRARFEGDLEAMFPGTERAKMTYPIVCTEDADYRFRISLPSMYVSDAIGRMVTAICYDNFKNAVFEGPPPPFEAEHEMDLALALAEHALEMTDVERTRYHAYHAVWATMFTAQDEAAGRIAWEEDCLGHVDPDAMSPEEEDRQHSMGGPSWRNDGGR